MSIGDLIRPMTLWSWNPRASAGVQLDAGVRQLQHTCSLGVVQVVLLMYNFHLGHTWHQEGAL